MNYDEINGHYVKIIEYLRKQIDTDRSPGLIRIYVGITDLIDLKNIIGRIEYELDVHEIQTNEVIRRVKANEEIDDEFVNPMIENFNLLHLDIKSFFIFTRIYLDNIARLIRYLYGKPGYQLPSSMSHLPTHKRSILLDKDFFNGLEEKMKWFDDFFSQRDEIVHSIGGIVSIKTLDGQFGIDVRSLKSHSEPWGTLTVTPMTEIIQNAISCISGIFEYIITEKL